MSDLEFTTNKSGDESRVTLWFQYSLLSETEIGNYEVFKEIIQTMLIDMRTMNDGPEMLISGEFLFEGHLIYKFSVDANDDLSIQLHPNDALAKERHNSFGKTEMWYVVDADKQSKLYVGFDKEYTKDQYLSKFNNGEILEMVNAVEVEKGAVFFIETGTVHAIGKGVLIAEIQQTSDLTYRIFDWNRTDDNGVSRELHTDLALEAFDFSKTQIENISYQNKSNQTEKLVSCPYFTTNKLNVEGSFKKDLSKIDSFVVYMCVEGSGEIAIGENKEQFRKGETILIPAIVDAIEIKGEAELLEVYIE